MHRCAFLTLADPRGYVIDDGLAEAPLGALGIGLESVPWNAEGIDWSRYELVVIRSPWDYQRAPREFLARLQQISRAGPRLENPLALVKWNLDKQYMRDLDRRGVAIVPTVWRERLGVEELPALFEALGSDEIVIKPVVGANAEDTFRLDRRAWASNAEEIADCFADRALMAQPFVDSVLSAGEYSLIYLGNTFSHAIRKTPRRGDFRVQEEHGGVIVAAKPAEELLAAAAHVLAALPETPLYARIDLVAAPAGRGYWLMELELVEPSLYLRMDPQAPARFAQAIAGCL